MKDYSWLGNIEEAKRIMAQIHAEHAQTAPAKKPKLHKVGRSMSKDEIRKLYGAKVTTRETGLK